MSIPIGTRVLIVGEHPCAGQIARVLFHYEAREDGRTVAVIRDDAPYRHPYVVCAPAELVEAP
jgi:hypothetical protein